MRTLSATLTAAQKAARISPDMSFIVSDGVTTDTYKQSRVLDILEKEEPHRHSCEVILDNSDNALTAKDYRGYQVTLGLGMTTLLPGTEASNQPPFLVISQRLDSYQGKLVCRLSCAGIPNMLYEDRASVDYDLEDDDTQTVKTLINAITGTGGVVTYTPFVGCHAYTVVYDSEDSLIDTFCPKDLFKVARGERRLAKLQELIKYTGCVMRFQAFYQIHIFVPTTSGTTYDYEYSLASGSHTFFAKSTRTRLVIPNFIQVDSMDDQTTPYTGSANNATSYGLVPVKEFYKLRVVSNAQCAAIAEAILGKYLLDAEAGQGHVPINVGAEVYDYVKITDARQGDSVVGNIGYIERHYTPGKYEMFFRLGRIDFSSLMGTIGSAMAGNTNWQEAFSHCWTYLEVLKDLIDGILNVLEMLKEQIGEAVDLAETEGTTTANWQSGTGTSGEAGADLVTIGADATTNVIRAMWISTANLNANAVITVRMYTLVKTTERKTYSQEYTVGQNTVSLWLINGQLTIDNALRIEVKSDNAADNGKAIEYEYTLED